MSVDWTIGDSILYTTDSSAAGATGAFHIGTEVFFYTGNTGTNLTGVSGAQDGTAAANHLRAEGGNEVEFGMEAHWINTANEEIVAIQTELGTNLDNVVRIDGTNALSADWDAGAFEIRAEQFESDIATGTAPLIIASTTAVSNLNADLLDGVEGAAYTAATVLESLIITSEASNATPAVARASKKTMHILTALAAASEFQNPTGTPANGDLLWLCVLDDGTGRALTYDTEYADYGTTPPTTTTANKELNILFKYSLAANKWGCICSTEQP